jgi:hypothetical protein
MELTIQEERGQRNSWQGEILLMHGDADVFETLWIMLANEEEASLLVRCFNEILYNYAAGWHDPECHLEDIAARLSALLHEPQADIEALLEHFCYEDLGFSGSGSTAPVIRLRLHYFDKHGVPHRVIIDGKDEIVDKKASIASYSHR